MREKLPFGRVERCSHNVLFRSERVQRFTGIVWVVEGERGRAVRRDYLPERFQLPDRGSTKRQDFISKEGRTREEEHRSAREQNDAHQRPANRCIAKAHGIGTGSETVSAERNNFELMLSPADLAASKLMRSRTRPRSIKKRTTAV